MPNLRDVLARVRADRRLTYQRLRRRAVDSNCAATIEARRKGIQFIKGQTRKEAARIFAGVGCRELQRDHAVYRDRCLLEIDYWSSGRFVLRDMDARWTVCA